VLTEATTAAAAKEGKGGGGGGRRRRSSWSEQLADRAGGAGGAGGGESKETKEGRDGGDGGEDADDLLSDDDEDAAAHYFTGHRDPYWQRFEESMDEGNSLLFQNKYAEAETVFKAGMEFAESHNEQAPGNGEHDLRR
jgi:hypothetical protein